MKGKFHINESILLRRVVSVLKNLPGPAEAETLGRLESRQDAMPSEVELVGKW